MKGADQCPRCASRKTVDIELPIKLPNGEPQTFYARTVRGCLNCNTLWEPFDEADLLDEGERWSSFKHPCNNCAFRKGSPEQSDPVRWQELMDQLGWYEGRFYCHKGVPISAENENGFDYPDPPKPNKMRLCRGYLNWLNSQPMRAKAMIEKLREGNAPDG